VYLPNDIILGFILLLIGEKNEKIDFICRKAVLINIEINQIGTSHQ